MSVLKFQIKCMYCLNSSGGADLTRGRSGVQRLGFHQLHFQTVRGSDTARDTNKEMSLHIGNAAAGDRSLHRHPAHCDPSPNPSPAIPTTPTPLVPHPTQQAVYSRGIRLCSMYYSVIYSRCSNVLTRTCGFKT